VVASTSRRWYRSVARSGKLALRATRSAPISATSPRASRSERRRDDAGPGDELAAAARAGRGTVNLPQRAVDMMLDTRLVATLQGQGGRAGLHGAGACGPFDHLSYRPDPSGISREGCGADAQSGELLRNPGRRAT
jgi:hypothetical protein